MLINPLHILTMLLLLLSVIMPVSASGKDTPTLVTYPAPAGAPMMKHYDVRVMSGNSGKWSQVETYMAKVNAPVGKEGHEVKKISYGVFDFTGTVTVRVTRHNNTYKNVRVRPSSKSIGVRTLNDSTVEFTLRQPENISVEFDKDITDNLLLFSSAPCISVKDSKKVAKKEGRKFIHYKPGLYTDEVIRVSSNTTVYLEGGSYFTGTFAIEDAENVSIVGRGIARPANGYEGCHVHRSKNVCIQGLTVNTCPVGGSDRVVLRDVRSISHPGWGDGLNIFASSNVLFDRVFCRNSDDCTTAYATRKGFSGSVRNIRMQNSTLWADVAHPIFIGLHGNPAVGDSIVNLVYDNIDILGQSEPQTDYQGCLAINVGDDNYVKNVTFSNIRIEDINNGCITQVKVGYNQKYCTAPGRGVENVTFSNITYNGAQPNLSIMTGYNEERMVKNVTFHNFVVNGRHIHDDMPGKPKWYSTSDYVPMFIGNHVKNVTFK